MHAKLMGGESSPSRPRVKVVQADGAAGAGHLGVQLISAHSARTVQVNYKFTRVPNFAFVCSCFFICFSLDNKCVSIDV